jgi:MinD-like ATPase involved in chromosome partitioning or flagellar assembly
VIVLLCLASLKGSPGVTTSCVALAACWPQPWQRLLVEADPAGGDLAARYRLPVTPGLVSLAAAARRSTDPAVIDAHVHLLAGGLPVAVGPTRADQARAALAAITGADGHAGVLGSFTGRGDVVAVVDCGRLDPDTPLRGVIAAADQLLIAARPHADALAHVADLVAAGSASILAEVLGGAARTRLLLVGDGYPASEVEREVGLTVAGTLPWDPRTAAAVSGHATRTPRARAGLVRAATRLAANLAGDPRRLPATEPATGSGSGLGTDTAAGGRSALPQNGATGTTRWSQP